ncbi:lysophospholipid acyltransferase family protein [Alishewanella sp. 16-MA]|uniref:L-ornithine N(alpha)-acyltransferase n=1 Tax=Alishewanella maricola TaxID=2795740 RepID=A0ABS8C410_9ALTE|nr:lysophospholipid acyltransferase family protein [Alishewanella maricola]MCB5227071.1 lysophospholipid acyltransferase family protein [Alishewanella maricola]MDP5036494.1 lysophospholipid acyltransferase family protein [Alishewanella sp.]
MLNVEQLLEQHFMSDQPKPWWYRPGKMLLSYLLHEREFQAFAARYPHLQGMEFVEQVLEYFQFSYSVRDDELDHIPSTGPVLLIANHPIGSLDGLALLKLVSGLRPDLKIMANQLLMSLAPMQNLLLPVNNLNGGTERHKLEAIQQHLAAAGALIIFPAGEVSRLRPQGVRDGKWHSGFLRLASQANAPIVPLHLTARNSWVFYAASALYKPLASMLLVREMFKQKGKTMAVRIGEQIPCNSFSQLSLPVPVKVKLFKKQLYRLATDRPSLFITQTAIARPEPRAVLKKAMSQCQRLGETRDGKLIYLYQHQQSSPIMREIGRLRELAFRAVGEGTGQRRDIDRFDSHYAHLLLWDNEDLEIVGAYRLADTNKVLAEQGPTGLYTQTLFQFSPSMQPYLAQGLELGRSFVQPRYWGKRSLEYLWYGIGAYLKQNPQVRYLFGGVSLSNSYPVPARDLLVYFYGLYFGSALPSAEAKRPYPLAAPTVQQLAQHFTGNDYAADFSQLKHLLANMKVSVPTLYKQYSELCTPGGTTFLAFGIDPEFANCVDGLVLVDLSLVTATKRARYLD